MSASQPFWRAWDQGLFAAGAVLTLISGVEMVSAAAMVNPSLATRHALWIAVGFLAGIGVAGTEYRRWGEFVWIAYGLSVAALALVLIGGAVRLGASRWLSVFGLSVQPSEFAKLATLWLLARYLAGQPTPLPPRVVWTSLLFVIPPAALVFLQPDLGSASIFAAIWFGMTWAAGAPRGTLTALTGGVLALAPVAWHALKDYQRDRLMAFIDPHADPLGAGYTIIQSIIAIGSGQLWGRGWFAGTQNQLSFLPERHSDFMFSVLGEEWGLLGSLTVVVVFGVLLTRILRIGSIASDPQGRLLAVGVFSWLAYQAFVNMGMVMGLLPVVGIPLPLISYGGSSMVTVWMALGILQSVRRSEFLL